MITLFAHAGETHSEGIEAVAHYVAPWYFAIPAFIFVVAAIGYLVWLIGGKDLGKVLVIEAGLLLIIGFGLFNISPIVSAIAIILGMFTAGFLALAGLSAGK